MPRRSIAFTVRTAHLSDAAAIAHVQRETWRTQYTGVLPQHVLQNVPGGRVSAWQGTLASREQKRFPVIVAEAAPGDDSAARHVIDSMSSNVVGFASCGPARDATLGFDVEVYSIYVLREFQRAGIGRALLAEIARRAVAQGLFTLYLWALANNPSRMFYLALGGEEVAEKTTLEGGIAAKQVAYGWRDLSPLMPSLARAQT